MRLLGLLLVEEGSDVATGAMYMGGDRNRSRWWRSGINVEDVDALT